MTENKFAPEIALCACTVLTGGAVDTNPSCAVHGAPVIDADDEFDDRLELRQSDYEDS